MSKNTKIAIAIGVVVLLALIVLPALWGGYTGWQSGGWGMMGPWMMGGLGGGWVMAIFMVLIPILVIWAIVALVRGTSSQAGTGSSAQTESALEVLKKRYARGEISKEEYEEKRKDLA
ncbi:MAG: SHOCT domain-containing protein [Chloroflexota bacterium]